MLFGFFSSRFSRVRAIFFGLFFAVPQGIPAISPLVLAKQKTFFHSRRCDRAVATAILALKKTRCGFISQKKKIHTTTPRRKTGKSGVLRSKTPHGRCPRGFHWRALGLTSRGEMSKTGSSRSGRGCGGSADPGQKRRRRRAVQKIRAEEQRALRRHKCCGGAACDCAGDCTPGVVLPAVHQPPRHHRNTPPPALPAGTSRLKAGRCGRYERAVPRTACHNGTIRSCSPSATDDGTVLPCYLLLLQQLLASGDHRFEILRTVAQREV